MIFSFKLSGILKEYHYVRDDLDRDCSLFHRFFVTETMKSGDDSVSHVWLAVGVLGIFTEERREGCLNPRKF